LGVVVAASLTMVGATAAAQSTAPTPGSGQSATGAHGQDTRSPASRQDDSSKFYKKAAMGNMAEIELGKLGARKAQDPQVKQFAQQMVDAHQRALDNLKEVAAGNVSGPPRSTRSTGRSWTSWLNSAPRSSTVSSWR